MPNGSAPPMLPPPSHAAVAQLNEPAVGASQDIELIDCHLTQRHHESIGLDGTTSATIGSSMSVCQAETPFILKACGSILNLVIACTRR
jgi:hypothetical protein